MRRRTLLALTLALALAAGLNGSASPARPAGFLAEVTWNGSDRRFGGFSAIAVAPDGTGFAALSDRGATVRGRLLRDADGRLVGVEGGPIAPLRRPDGKLLTHPNNDSEGLAMAPDGSFFVSFEGGARIRRYATPDAPAENIKGAPEFDAMKGNGSLESLCIDRQGRLYTLPEESGGIARPFPVFRWTAGLWEHFGTIARGDEFRAVDCALGPDGRFYLLQRAFYGLGGFASRLLRFDLGAEGLSGRKVIFQSPAGTFDDLEGLSIWRDGAGGLRATMVSDNNFSFLFVTEIVEFALPD